jgi:hypothetical protein
MKGLCAETCQIPVKEIEEDTNKMENIPCSWIGEMNIVKLHTTKHVHTTHSMNLYQKPKGIFHMHRKNNPNICMKPQKILNSQAILSEKTRKPPQTGGITLLDFKIHYKAIVIKTTWHVNKNKYTH